MTEKEKIVEELQKQLLKEMAITKSELINRLLDKVPTLLQHLILVILFPNDKNINHWKKEIRINSDTYIKLKTNNKYPAYNDLAKGYLDTVKDIINDQLIRNLEDIFEDENIDLEKYINNIDYNLLKQLLYSYFEFICKNIDPNTGIVDKNLIYNKINDIIKEYNNEKEINSNA